MSCMVMPPAPGPLTLSSLSHIRRRVVHVCVELEVGWVGSV